MRRKTTIGNVPVYVDRNDANPLYEELVNRAAKDAEDYPFATKKDLFVLAACVGANCGRFEELATDRRMQIFDGETFRDNTDVPILAALAYYHEKNLDVLFEPSKIVRIAEGYAQTGIYVVHRQITTGLASRPLNNLVDMILQETHSKLD